MIRTIIAVAAISTLVELSAETKCDRPGPMAVAGSPQEFDICILTENGEWEVVRHTCHGNYLYNETKRTCLPLGISLMEVKLNCRKAGAMCSDCRTAVMCIDKGDGVVRPLATKTCPSGTTCQGGICQENALCNIAQFQCSDNGIYPDPYDCRKYHLCLDTVSHGTCPTGSYDVSTLRCDGPLDSKACKEGLIPMCTREYELGPIPGVPHLYYICSIREGKILAPELHRCSFGERFNATTFNCDD